MRVRLALGKKCNSYRKQLPYVHDPRWKFPTYDSRESYTFDHVSFIKYIPNVKQCIGFTDLAISCLNVCVCVLNKCVALKRAYNFCRHLRLSWSVCKLVFLWISTAKLGRRRGWPSLSSPITSSCLLDSLVGIVDVWRSDRITQYNWLFVLRYEMKHRTKVTVKKKKLNFNNKKFNNFCCTCV